MTPTEFAALPAALDHWSAALQSLWWAAKGEWDKSHALVQGDACREAAWVHAYLHRVEGDAANAAYWYRRAGEPVCALGLEDEWRAIAAALLAGERRKG